MSVGEGRREGSCDVSDNIENNFGFEGHIIDFEELLNKNQNTLGLGSLGYCGVILQACLCIAVWGTGNKAHIRLHLENKMISLHILLRTSSYSCIHDLATGTSVWLATSMQLALAVDYLATELVSKFLEGTCACFA